MKNEYEIRGDVTAIIIKSPKYGIMETVINTSNLEEVKKFPNSWCINKDGNTFYVIGNTPVVNGKRTIIILHRLIMGNPDGFLIDHIDHDGLNNTTENLRIVTNSENQQNRKGARANSKSGVRGVHFRKDSKKWLVVVNINRIKKYFGEFNTLEEAEQVAIEARMHHMPFSQESTL